MKKWGGMDEWMGGKCQQTEIRRIREKILSKINKYDSKYKEI